MIRVSINDLADEEFDLWMQNYIDTCENIRLIGYSKYCLHGGKKTGKN